MIAGDKTTMEEEPKMFHEPWNHPEIELQRTGHNAIQQEFANMIK